MGAETIKTKRHCAVVGDDGRFANRDIELSSEETARGMARDVRRRVEKEGQAGGQAPRTPFFCDSVGARGGVTSWSSHNSTKTKKHTHSRRSVREGQQSWRARCVDDKTKHNKTKHNKTKHNTKQNKTQQNKTQQDKTQQNNKTKQNTFTCALLGAYTGYSLTFLP
eukprot:7125951-Prymnesium_polylepis.1